MGGRPLAPWSTNRVHHGGQPGFLGTAAGSGRLGHRGSQHRAARGEWPTIDVLSVPERTTVKNRLHLDLRADGVPTEVELQRLLELGAHRVDVGQSPEVSWVVLADPEGNEFCLLSRSVQDL
ncbi:MAG: VOC family protein [Mycobacteriales bacterium]